MFFRKKKKTGSYDRRTLVPVIRSSICTGEKTAGFRNLETGKLEEVMLIRGEADLQEFLETYGIAPQEIKTEY